MKTIRRILAVLTLIIIVFAISYIVYTAKNFSGETAVLEVLYEVAKTT